MMICKIKSRRLWIKQEKRIIKLIYKKGLMPDYISVGDLYWAERRKNKRPRRGEWKYYDYLPEVHYYQEFGWDDGDEISVVKVVCDDLYWQHQNETTSSFKFKSREWFIRYLKELPAVVNDNKINKALRLNYSNL